MEMALVAYVLGSGPLGEHFCEVSGSVSHIWAPWSPKSNSEVRKFWQIFGISGFAEIVMVHYGKNVHTFGTAVTLPPDELWT